MSGEEIDAIRSSPLWPVRLAAAPTVPRECRVEEGWVYRPGQFDAVASPTLVLAGSDSLPTIAATTRWAAAAIPGAQVRVLDGHAHFAHKTDPALVAGVIRRFTRTSSPSGRLPAPRRANHV
jgi:pimeloyl-ACP methyl ester carboxylesterase